MPLAKMRRGIADFFSTSPTDVWRMFPCGSGQSSGIVASLPRLRYSTVPSVFAPNPPLPLYRCRAVIMPVWIEQRDGAHIPAAARALRKVIPCLASFSTFGISM